jgi:hypothetical protein
MLGWNRRTQLIQHGLLEKHHRPHP